MAGRRPLPTALKLIRGNPGKRPLNANEPKPDNSKPVTCPRNLDKIARAEWRRLHRELDKLGLLTQVDRSAFAQYCQAYSRDLEAEEHLRAEGLVVKTYYADGTVKGVGPNPWLSIQNKAKDNMRKFAVEFGMTPSSRSRISVAKPADTKGKFDDI